MSSRASRPRSRRRLVGVSAVAVGALLTTYAGGLRNFSYVRAEPMSALSGCSGGATEVTTDDSLQEAITNSVDGAVICVTENITVSQTLVLDDTSVTLEGDDSSVTLSGGGVTRILYANFRSGSDDTLILRNLTLTQGTSLNADDSDGGAVLVRGNSRADTFIGEDITVTDSYSFEDGGGIALASMEYARLSGARFYDDSAASDSGAFEINFANSVVIQNSVFKRNTAITRSGGAFEFQDVLDVRVYSSTFSDNESSSDGGSTRVYNGSDYVLLRDSTFADDSTGSDGGSLALSDIASLRFDNVDVNSGQAARYGGAAYLKDDTYVQVINSTFSSNSAPNDGGAVHIDGSDDTVAVRNSGFYGNSTTGGGSGGGLYISDQDGPVVLENVTAHDNTAASSGGFLRVFDLTSTLTINGLESRRNYANSDGGSIKQTGGVLDLSSSVFMDDSAGSDGGSISVNDDTALISTSTFTGNHAGIDGGAIYARATTYFAIRNGIFTQNMADDDGGGVYIRSDDSTAASAIVRLEDSIFTSNTSVDDGGGVYLYQLNAAYLTGLTVQGNKATGASGDGGGLSTYNLRSLSIQSSTFRGNSAANDGGGAWLGQSALTLTTSTFADNTAGDYGGGASIYDVTSGLTISDTTFSGNSAVSGAGGVYAEFAGQADITNSTFVGNSHSDPSKPGAGGLWLDGAAGQATLDFLTVVGNTTVSQGGGLYLSDLDALVTNSIVAGNTAGGIGADVYLGYSFDGSGVLASLDDSYSLFTSSGSVDRDPSAGAFTFTPGPGTIFGAPKLNGLADNGGPTLTMLPQWDSPAFQAGDPNWTAPPTNDQRGTGFPRDAGGRVSMGAIQGRSAKPAPPPAVPASPPREVKATAGDREVLVSWTPPASTGTFPITAYQVDDSTGAHSCLLNVAPGDPLSCVIEDLTNGTAYSFRVRALTGAGWGAWSDFTADVTPEPGPSIMITGTREGKFAAVAGVTTGLVGETLIPRLRFPGPHAYEDGVARPVVDDAGDFTWQRQTRKKVYVYFFTEDRELRSNRVIIRPRG